MNSNQPRILGFIGVGAMGEGMCRNLTKKSGLPVHVADLNPEAVARLAADGARASSIAALRQGADTVFLSLPSIAEVEDVCFGATPLIAPGGAVKTVVDMSTSDVPRTRALAERLAAQGVRFLDAPVARSREAARNGTLLITVGGPLDLFQQLHPLLGCMGTDVVRCGDTGAGQIVKIMNNMVLLSTVNAVAEAMAIAEAAGVDKTLLADTLKLGSADSFGLRLTADRIAQDSFPEKLFPTAYALKDIRLALSLAYRFNIRPVIAESATALLDAAMARGYAQNYYPVVYRLIRSGKPA
jgi:3-hydroxyisobutyrate dehydrogenase-like beta-hydroxyacid dehydrogenase